jgi:hypothetical protein
MNEKIPADIIGRSGYIVYNVMFHQSNLQQELLFVNNLFTISLQHLQVSPSVGDFI